MSIPFNFRLTDFPVEAETLRLEVREFLSTALADVIMTLPAKAIAESLVKFFIFTSLVLKPVRSLFLPWLRV